MSSKSRKHVLLITISGYGHIVPMVSLAKRLLSRHNITLAVPAFSLRYIRQKGELPPGFEDEANVIGIDNGIPHDINEYDGIMQEWFTQFTDGLPRLQQFLLEMPATAPPVRVKDRIQLDLQIGSSSSPVDLVIGDVFLTEAMSVLSQRTIPYYIFNCSALGPFAGLLFVTPDTPIAEESELPPFRLLRTESEGPQPVMDVQTKQLGLSINSSLGGAKGFVVNSIREFESRIEEIASDPRMQGKEYYFVGPLMPEESAGTKTHVLKEVNNWLDRKPDRSVIYVSFGGYAVEDEPRIATVGTALANMGKPFIFALREHQHKLLGPELEAMTQIEDPDSSGLILHWVPQKTVLAHPAVGVFLSHCGWNSTMECIFHGKPVVGWPCFGDQLENALWIEQAGMGRCLVQADVAYSSGNRPRISAEQIVEAVEEASSLKCFKAAKEWQSKARKAVLPGGDSYEDLERFMKYV